MVMKYQNDYERDETQKYEGVYTSAEKELNKKLYDECQKKHIDFRAVEELLKQGADPLGGTDECGWGLLEHIYGELVADSQLNDSVYLPKITELFLKYGMDVENPRIPYDNENSIDPMWDFAFVTNENNKYDVHNFRDWDKFDYFFDTSHCDRIPELYGSVIHIYEKDSGTEVWRIGVGRAEREVLEAEKGC